MESITIANGATSATFTIPGLELWITKGGSTITSPDGIGLPATQSSLSISGGPQAFEFTLTPALEVVAGGSATKNLVFSPNGARELWDVSVLLGNAVGTNFKILPVSQAPSNVQ